MRKPPRIDTGDIQDAVIPTFRFRADDGRVGMCSQQKVLSSGLGLRGGYFPAPSGDVEARFRICAS
eukprot:1381115-Amorphochlora_amoeboformis.AAC.2